MTTIPLPMLTEEERLTARDRARSYVIKRKGEKPTRTMYDQATISEYPDWMIKATSAAIVIALLASAAISMFRLYAAGHNYFMATLPVKWQAELVGYSTSIMAEFLVVTATIAAALFFTGRSKALMIMPVMIGLSVAFVGNWEITRAHGVWGWLDTIAPPLSVLSLSWIAEKVFLSSMKQRYANEKAFQAALAEWERAAAEPEADPAFNKMYATALREIYIQAHGRKAQVKALDRGQWSQVIYREMQADDWYTPPVEMPVIEEPPITQEDTDQRPLSDQHLTLDGKGELRSAIATP